ncbi:hypothetical protein CAPGI0001_2398 [Capnocytophaga gingivalis ATCC 33624]|uniref:DUF6493 family protein n=1 Tax=Capnocytophaga gingivalis TaxID=1017 RepID=UPI00019FB854|nr:DUF6493 family protein [Capnocytophaga gingivalis]EEK13427.1 hypothetical protein CAPGI0001_2398 [Capnocytophaga gingivalis ATCC 33624]
MKENLLSAIKAHDFTAIRNICFGLSEEERQELKSYFARKNFNFIFREILEKEKRYHFSNKELAIISYTIMCVCNTLEEVRKIELFQNIEPYVKGNYYYFLSSLEDEVLLDFVQTPQGAYMIEGIQLMYKDNPLEMSFQILWSVYKAGYIPLNEGVFIQKMYDLNWFKADEHLTKYLLKHPETVVLFPSVPAYIQDTIFTTEEWKKIYHTLNKKGYLTNKNAILHSFIEALLNPWKKTVLDMYCRWIETFEPSHQELLSNQHTLFALLSSDKTSVVNFVMKLIKEIASEKDFDFQAFADNFSLCFTTQKIAKSQLVGLDILEKHYKKQAPTNPDYREQLAVLFTVPDAQLQEKVANLLTTYFSGEGLAEVVAPYQDYLKGKAQDLLATLSPSENSENSENSQIACAARTSQTACVAHTPKIAYAARTPRTWDDLLFLIGDCIRERSPLVLDLFFEGLNQLQAQIPADYPEQVKPYLKQLLSNERAVTSLFYQFLDSWCSQSPIPLVYNTNKEWNELQELYNEKKYSQAEKFNKLREIHVSANKAKKIFPFFFNKIACALQKLKEKDTLPFISTPTHAPFYIEPLTFLERVIQYEKAGKTPMQEDVIIGLNRLLPTEITEAQKQLALSLTGDYTPALQYYFEVNKQIAVTDATRVLWGQVLRLKDIDGVFPELEIPQKSNLQGLVRPFYLKYEVELTKINGVERNKIILEDNWDKKHSTYSYYNELGANYYNVSPMGKVIDEDIDYELSLNPRYIDGWLCKYLLTYTQGMDSESLSEATRVMSLLLQYNLPIYHGGWLMVATCLLAERKPLRDLAAEYILLSLQREKTLSYLAEAIGTLLAHKYAPIARFVEFLDLPTRDPKVKGFQKAVVEAYLPLAEKQEKKPTNHKKLASFLIN